MQFEHQGLTLWFGTPDAPCPANVVEAGGTVSLRVGIKPADASNVVKITYRVNGGTKRSVRAKWVWTHPENGVQYFEADLGEFEAGDHVQYTPSGVCAGRRVEPVVGKVAAASFRVGTMSRCNFCGSVAVIVDPDKRDGYNCGCISRARGRGAALPITPDLRPVTFQRRALNENDRMVEMAAAYVQRLANALNAYYAAYLRVQETRSTLHGEKMEIYTIRRRELEEIKREADVRRKACEEDDDKEQCLAAVKEWEDKERKIVIDKYEPQIQSINQAQQNLDKVEEQEALDHNKRLVDIVAAHAQAVETQIGSQAVSGILPRVAVLGKPTEIIPDIVYVGTLVPGAETFLPNAKEFHEEWELPVVEVGSLEEILDDLGSPARSPEFRRVRLVLHADDDGLWLPLFRGGSGILSASLIRELLSGSVEGGDKLLHLLDRAREKFKDKHNAYIDLRGCRIVKRARDVLGGIASIFDISAHNVTAPGWFNLFRSGEYRPISLECNAPTFRRLANNEGIRTWLWRWADEIDIGEGALQQIDAVFQLQLFLSLSYYGGSNPVFFRVLPTCQDGSRIIYLDHDTDCASPSRLQPAMEIWLRSFWANPPEAVIKRLASRSVGDSPYSHLFPILSPRFPLEFGGCDIAFPGNLSFPEHIMSGTDNDVVSIWILGGSPDARAFYPSRQDKSGIIELEADVRNAPPDARYLWENLESEAVEFSAPDSTSTKLKTLRPGHQRLSFTVYSSDNQVLERIQTFVSVPQFVAVAESAEFYRALGNMTMTSYRSQILKVAKEVCDYLLRTSNARTIWLMAPFNETIPTHLPAEYITSALFCNRPFDIEGTDCPVASPENTGKTFDAQSDIFNEKVVVYAGNFVPAGSHPAETEMDEVTRWLMRKFAQINFLDPAAAELVEFAIQVYGRLIGHALAHEIVHALLGMDIPTYHNPGSGFKHDLMNKGEYITFTDRTGFERVASREELHPSLFLDHGIAGMGGLQSVNIKTMSRRFPVPPWFK